MMNIDMNTVLGILAHVDAGKTTLSEAMLYLSGKIKKLGRVDHRDSFLDTHSLERSRGITIFSKQARFALDGRDFTLLDTPGHVDFSAEMERTLQVLDYAVLVISGTDGVQAHTGTLWRLLERYGIPCFIFVTKTDLPGMEREALMAQLCGELSDGCVDFTEEDGDLFERIALCDEAAMEKYLDSGSLADEDIRELIRSRRLFPCYFGSGLKLDGVAELLEGMEKYTRPGDYGGDFGARVYKIARDGQGNRLTYLKCTGGELKVRTLVKYRDEHGEEREEKISALRLYSGEKFEPVESVSAGQICAALGLSASWPGQGLGAEPDSPPPVLEPVLSYRMLLPEGLDAAQLLPKLRLLQQEDPQLHLGWNERSGEITVQLMGKVQTEILKSLVKDRFDVDISLDTGRTMCWRKQCSRKSSATQTTSSFRAAKAFPKP